MYFLTIQILRFLGWLFAISRYSKEWIELLNHLAKALMHVTPKVPWGIKLAMFVPDSFYAPFAWLW